MLALGDALAIACLDTRGFGSHDFARTSRGCLTPAVRACGRPDAHRRGEPAVAVDASVMDAVHEITRAKIGMTAVVHADGRVRQSASSTEATCRRLLESWVMCARWRSPRS